MTNSMLATPFNRTWEELGLLNGVSNDKQDNALATYDLILAYTKTDEFLHWQEESNVIEWWNSFFPDEEEFWLTFIDRATSDNWQNIRKVCLFDDSVADTIIYYAANKILNEKEIDFDKFKQILFTLKFPKPKGRMPLLANAQVLIEALAQNIAQTYISGKQPLE